jgi:hypothetical protein
VTELRRSYQSAAVPELKRAGQAQDPLNHKPCDASPKLRVASRNQGAARADRQQIVRYPHSEACCAQDAAARPSRGGQRLMNVLERRL